MEPTTPVVQESPVVPILLPRQRRDRLVVGGNFGWVIRVKYFSRSIGRHYSAVRALDLQYPISFAQMAEMAAERGLATTASCISRWVQVYGPEIDKRCRPHLKRTKRKLAAG